METIEFTGQQTMLLFQLLSELSSEKQVEYVVGLLSSLTNKNGSFKLEKPLLIACELSLADVIRLSKKYNQSLTTSATNTLVGKTVLEVRSIEIAQELVHNFRGKLVFNAE